MPDIVRHSFVAKGSWPTNLSSITLDFSDEGMTLQAGALLVARVIMTNAGTSYGPDYVKSNVGQGDEFTWHEAVWQGGSASQHPQGFYFCNADDITDDQVVFAITGGTRPLSIHVTQWTGANTTPGDWANWDAVGSTETSGDFNFAGATLDVSSAGQDGSATMVGYSQNSSSSIGYDADWTWRSEGTYGGDGHAIHSGAQPTAFDCVLTSVTGNRTGIMTVVGAAAAGVNEVSGAAVAPLAVAAGTVGVDVGAAGTIGAPAGAASAQVGIEISAQGSLGAPLPVIAGAVGVRVEVTGALQAPLPQVGLQVGGGVSAQGAAIAPLPALAGAAAVRVEVTGAPQAPAPVVGAIVDVGADDRSLSAALVAPLPQVVAAGAVSIALQAAAVAPLPVAALVVGDPLSGLTLIKTRVFDFFAVQFPAKHPTVAIAWQGLPYTPGSETWVRISVLSGKRQHITLGPNATNRRTGIIYIDVFAPFKDSPNASLDAAELSDSIEKIFDDGTISGVRLRAASTQDIGPDPQLPFYHNQVTVEFSRDDNN